VPAPPRGLYVHVPYCVSICPYCDFVVVAGAAARGPRSSIGRFLEAVEVELELRASALDAQWGQSGARPPLETLYVGGGTPSLVPAPALAGLIDLVGRRFGLAAGAEVSVEANPGLADRGDAAALRAGGVTRLSIGAQSLDDRELRELGRRHLAADVRDAVGEARAAGIPSLSLDLLYDVPGQTPGSWRRTLDAALELEPDHLSLYALTLDDPAAEGLTGPLGDHLPPSDGARRWRAAARGRQDDDRAAELYELADRRLAEAGYAWYEISNWARPGHRSRHNLAYWQRRPVEAVGPGAHAFDGRVRRWNAAPLGPYLDALASLDGTPPRLPPGDSEVVVAEEAASEATILALRLGTGITRTEARTGPLARHLGWAIAAGLLTEIPEGRLVLTLRGRLLSNELFARLV
jgi:putative oxygen-independent coproporphyrinogen III oxidase